MKVHTTRDTEDLRDLARDALDAADFVARLPGTWHVTSWVEPNGYPVFVARRMAERTVDGWCRQEETRRVRGVYDPDTHTLHLARGGYSDLPE